MIDENISYNLISKHTNHKTNTMIDKMSTTNDVHLNCTALHYAHINEHGIYVQGPAPKAAAGILYI